MALQLEYTHNDKVGDYWLILKKTSDVVEDTTLVRLYLFNDKAYRDGFAGKPPHNKALCHESITVKGSDLRSEDIYPLLKESKMSVWKSSMKNPDGTPMLEADFTEEETNIFFGAIDIIEN